MTSLQAIWDINLPSSTRHRDLHLYKTARQCVHMWALLLSPKRLTPLIPPAFPETHQKWVHSDLHLSIKVFTFRL